MEGKTTRGCRGSGSSKTARSKQFKSLSAEARQERIDESRRRQNALDADHIQSQIEAMKRGFMSPLFRKRPFSVEQVFRRNFDCEPPLLRVENEVDFTHMQYCIAKLKEKHVNAQECQIEEEAFYQDLQSEIQAIELEKKTTVLKDLGEHPDYVSVQAPQNSELVPGVEDKILFLKSQPYSRNKIGQILLPYPVRIRRDRLDLKQAFYDLKIFSFVSEILEQVGDYGHMKMHPEFKENLDKVEASGLEEIFLRDNPVIDILYQDDLYILYPVFTGLEELDQYLCGSQRRSLASQHALVKSANTRKVINMATSAHAFKGTRMYEKSESLRLLIFGLASDYWKRRWKIKRSPPCCSSKE